MIMKCYHALYFTRSLASRKEEILKKIKKRKWQFETYLIVLAKNSENHLEIFHSALLLQKLISDKELFLVGIADGYEEAVELVEKIVQEVYDENGNTDIRNYILNKQEEYEKGDV